MTGARSTSAAGVCASATPGANIIVGLDFGVSLYNEVTKALGDGWAGGTHVSTGLDTGVIDFLRSPLFEKDGPADINTKAAEGWAAVQKAKAAILDGSLKVPFNTEL